MTKNAYELLQELYKEILDVEDCFQEVDPYGGLWVAGCLNGKLIKEIAEFLEEAA